MLKRFWREALAVLSGVAFAYCWQLFFLIFIENRTPADFIPVPVIQLVAAPIVAWCCFALYRVRWMEIWLRGTAVILGIAVPFCGIAGVAILVAPTLWRMPVFWLITVVITTVVATRLIKMLFEVLHERKQTDLGS